LCVGFAFNLSHTFAADKKAPKFHTELLAQIPLYDDPELAAFVDGVGQKLVKNSNIAGQYYFFVLDDPGINAFTPGGGYIYMNRGLLALMTSEAQLAGVLAHEIGHNVGNHIGRTKTRSKLGSIGAVVASIIVGNSNVGNSIQLANQAKLSSFGREMELEADQFAADYLYKSNYDPQAMLGVLGVLKDHESLSSIRNSRKGKGGATYHGVFSSHPRNDKRLQEVIAQAGALAPGESFQGRDSMREMLNGVVYGLNYNGNKPLGKERYAHKGLGITFVYPEGWQRTNKGKDIILKNADKTIQLKISLQKTVNKKSTSEQALRSKYPDDLRKVEPIGEEAKRDLGTMGQRPQQRVGLIRVGRNSYYFQGIAKNNQLIEEQDQQLVEIIKSFRRATSEDLPPDSIKSIYYERLKPGQTFAELAKNAELGMFTEEHLRLMNGYYPKGEAEPGTWIKLIKSGPLLPTEKKADTKQIQ
jgi:predicted Zn-dependent protease